MVRHYVIMCAAVYRFPLRTLGSSSEPTKARLTLEPSQRSLARSRAALQLSLPVPHSLQLGRSTSLKVLISKSTFDELG